MTSAVLDHLDPALPRLGECLRADQVATSFAGRWPGPGGPVEVLGCRRHDVRYKPGVSCASAWWLDVSRGNAAWRTIGVVETSGNNVAHRLYFLDPALPGLASAVQAELMADRLGAMFGAPPRACAVRVVRCRPGQRAVLRYDLEVADGTVALFAKITVEGVVDIGSVLGALHAAAGRVPTMPEVPQPLAVFADLAMVVQPLAQGVSLKDSLFPGVASQASNESCSGGQLEAMRQAGRILAGFHSCGVPSPLERRLVDDVAAVRGSIPLVQRIQGDLASRMARALDTLSRIGTETAEPVPSHGSFRADHVLLTAGRGGVIDLDGFCRAEPGRDAANLVGYLRWKAIREPQYAVLLPTYRSALLEGYDARIKAKDRIDERRCRTHEAAVLLRIAASRFRNLMTDEWPLVPRLVDAAAELCGSH